MAVNRPFVEGPEWVVKVREATELVNRLEANKWDFDTVPQAFARNAAADVVAKEVLHIHDGRMMTRFGHLIMGGVGDAFNLMGPIPSDSRFMVTDSTMLDEVRKQVGIKIMEESAEFEKIRARYGEIQRVKFPC